VLLGFPTRHLSPVHESVFDATERGWIDLLLCADDGRVPPNYPREAIFEDDLVCVVARDAYGSRRLTLEQYLRAPHVGVAIAGGTQTMPEKLLREAGRERRCAFRVPYFAMAVRSVAGTSLVVVELHN
jgi:DNA-binding transcriptional LysR family regulator